MSKLQENNLCHENSLYVLKLLIDKPDFTIQSTLGLETLDKAAALGLETATPVST